jgi:methylase of polypeptide subunit release factors
MDLAVWAELGLVQLRAGAVVATVQLLPCGDLVLAADWPGQPAGMHKHVMEIGGSSRTLLDFTIRRHSRRTLDLGTGCGIQAVLAAAHSDRVVAADRNPRAVNLAAFNACLNGLSNVDCREGDLFEPVHGEQFDLVVANLPFVICPEMRYLYCQSGMPGDELCRTVVGAVPRYLREGACCQIVSDLAQRKGENWREHLAMWFAGSGCDAWVICSLTLDAAAYAAQWIRATEDQELRCCAPQFDAWMAYYARERIEAIRFGLIALRRRSSGTPNWFRCEEVPETRVPRGDVIARGFALRDFLDTVQEDRVLLETRLRCAPDLRWDQELEPAAEGWALAASGLRAGGGWAEEKNADGAAIFMVSQCREGVRVRDVVAALAAETGQELEAIIPYCLAQARRLIEQGFLLPAGGIT